MNISQNKTRVIRLQSTRFYCVPITGNGYIEGNELDGFLREFVESVNKGDSGPEVVSQAMMSELKECFLEAYDDNKDGKIEIREVHRFFFFFCLLYFIIGLTTLMLHLIDID